MPSFSGGGASITTAAQLGSGVVTTDAILDNTIAAADIADDVITNTQIKSNAAIAYSKLNLASSIVNADVSNSAAIAYAKLALSNSIVAGDLAASARDVNITDSSELGGAAASITLNGGSSLTNAHAWDFGVEYSFDASTTQAVQFTINSITSYMSANLKLIATTVTGTQDSTGDPDIFSDTDLNTMLITGRVMQQDNVTGSATKKVSAVIFAGGRRYTSNNHSLFHTNVTADTPGAVTSIVLKATSTNFPTGTRYWCKQIDLF